MKGLIVLFLLVATTFAAQEKSGIKIRISRRGLDYASQLAPRILNEEIKKIQFPNVELPINGGPGNGHITLSNIHTKVFESPEFAYTMEPPHEFSFQSHNGRMTVYGDFDAWYKVLFKISTSGNVKASADGINIALGIRVQKTSDGLARVNVTKCSATFGDFSIEFGGGFIPWIVNIFRGPIGRKVHAALEDNICIAVQGALVDLANKELETLPTVIPVYQDFLLHYSLTEDPKVTENFVESQVLAEITYRGGNSTPLVPGPLPDVPTPANASRMIYLWGSDYVLNSFLYSAHKLGAIKYMVDKTVDPGIAQFLRTTCDVACIGTVIPVIGERYPNKSAEVLLYSSVAPMAKITPEGAILNGTVFADLYVEPLSGNEEDLLFRAQIVLSAELGVYVKRGKVVGNITINQFLITMVKSNIGPVSETALKVIGKVAAPALQEIANLHLLRGLIIPTVQGVGLANAQLALLQRAVQIDSDIRYKRFFPRHMLKIKDDNQIIV